jgi:putative ATPase
MYRPLADEIRPKTLDEVVGQEHILGKNGLLRRIIESGSIPNMIFYGPSAPARPPWQTSSPLPPAGRCTGSTPPPPALRTSNPSWRTWTRSCAGRHPAVSGRDPVFQQEAAAVPAGVHGKRQDHPDRLHHGKPVFLCVQRVLSRSTVFEFKPVSAADAERAVERAFLFFGRAGRAQDRGGGGRGAPYRLRLRARRAEGPQRGGASLLASL